MAAKKKSRTTSSSKRGRRLMEAAPESVQKALGILTPNGIARRMIAYAALNVEPPETESGYVRQHYKSLGRKIRHWAVLNHVELTHENIEEVMQQHLPVRYRDD